MQALPASKKGSVFGGRVWPLVLQVQACILAIPNLRLKLERERMRKQSHRGKQKRQGRRGAARYYIAREQRERKYYHPDSAITPFPKMVPIYLGQH